MCSFYRATLLYVWLLFFACQSSSFQVFVNRMDRRAVDSRQLHRKSVQGSRSRSIHPIAVYASSSSGDAMEESASVDASEGLEQSQNPTPTPQRKLDPLFLAVTKMDPQMARAKSVTIPIWGELILDRSLFVLLPIAVFAIGGAILSFYVLINSGDAFVDAIVQNSLQSVPTSSSTIDEAGCRGLCSSQAQDLDGLRDYMQRLGGR